MMINLHGRGQTEQLEDCFRIMKVEGNDDELYVPACVQFKVRNFTDVNFENLVAQVNGVLCVNFLIFTQDKQLETFLCDRLYFNPEEEEILLDNRRKKIGREAFNYVPIMFNKDDNIKIPTTRTKEFQIQSFKTKVKYQKGTTLVEGIRIFHILRKQFSVEIIKNGWEQNFFAPFDFIKLELVLSLEHMNVGEFQFKDPKSKHLKKIQQQYMQNAKIKDIKRLSFNLLRIEEPYTRRNLSTIQRVEKMAPMIAYSSEKPFGKYDVVETQLQGYTHDEREFRLDGNTDFSKEQLFEDSEPTQLDFKPFKYAVFKIPLFRYPVVDMMTIFIPLWLLSFVSVYIYFQTPEIMNRIVNVAGLMIAYAAIQPIVRENIPEATTITLVDLLIYSQLLINILFLCRSITLRSQQNSNYHRWSDGLFITSFAISIVNVIIVIILILNYMLKSQHYKAKPLPRCAFSISNEENWTLTLLMERTFARYRQKLIFLK